MEQTVLYGDELPELHIGDQCEMLEEKLGKFRVKPKLVDFKFFYLPTGFFAPFRPYIYDLLDPG